MSFLEIAIGLVLATQASGDGAAGTLEGRLRTEDPAALARDARRLGDARRGASVFYQPSLTCTKCHVERERCSVARARPDGAGQRRRRCLPRRVDPRSFEGDQERLSRPSRSAPRTAAP